MEMDSLSPLQKVLLNYKPELPSVFNTGKVKIRNEEKTAAISDEEAIQRMLPDIYGKPVVNFVPDNTKEDVPLVNVGVILSGGQAPGGHNVIAGLFDAMKASNPENHLFGFLGGPSGLIEGKYKELTSEIIDQYRNMGGFDIIGSGRTKLETEIQFEKVKKVCEKLAINAVVVIGGDDSNTNAALLAQYMMEKKSPLQVIGVPKTIDGDLKNKMIEISFGFDTAVKVYSEIIGNIEKDANSAKKYWHFIKLMGRSASHITLEAALQTHPNIAIISEEITKKKTTLDDLAHQICNVIIQRSKEGKNFGVILVPEGLIEFIPEIKTLFSELNTILGENEVYFKTLNTLEGQTQFINHHLSKESSFVFSSLPADIQLQMLSERDDHGNVSVSTIETEKLLIELCTETLNELKAKGEYGGKFAVQSHFLGYEGRCAAPSHFDAKYSYTLGFSAFHLIFCGLSGYMACVRNTFKPVTEWIAGGVPLTMMMNMEQRKGHLKPVIQKSLVDISGKPFRIFEAKREEWAQKEDYRFPGPIQYFGPTEISEMPNLTLLLEHE
jgi:diphosphate-dependent phosphofructokinase